MKQRKDKKKLAAIAGVVAVALIGGSLAYWSTTLNAKNDFNTGDYGTELVEKFKPSDGEDWQPGATVDKDVQVKNTGDQDVLVRVKFDEVWERNGDAFKEIAFDQASKEDPTKFAITNVYQQAKEDGLTAGDDTVVKKQLLLGTDWKLGSDGWYYYTKNLPADTITGKLLDSVTLASDADMGKYLTTYLYATVDNPTDGDWMTYDPAAGIPNNATYNKTAYTLDPAFPGYSSADYTLTVTTQVVQATKDAVIAEWFADESAYNTVVGTLGQSWNYLD